MATSLVLRRCQGWGRRIQTSKIGGIGDFAAGFSLGRTSMPSRKSFDEFVRQTLGAAEAPTTRQLSRAKIPELLAEYMALEQVHSQAGFEKWVREEKGIVGHRTELRKAFNQHSGLIAR
jgi:hypothetical protein